MAAARQRTEYHEPLLVPGLLHIGHDVFADAQQNGLSSHRHAGAYEVCYIKRGTLQWWVGERSFTIGPGELFMTLPDEVHGGQNDVMDPCELYWISFRLDAARGGSGMSAAEYALLDRSLRTSRMRICRGPATMVGHFQRILHTLGAPDQFTPVVARASLALLLAEVREAYARAASAPRTCSPRIQSAIAWMQEHLAEPIALDAIAARSGLSTSQFRSVFRAETGFAPLEHLTRLRIAKAKELLARPNLAITDVALASGFSTSQYFATTFKRITGFSPRGYRQRAVG